MREKATNVVGCIDIETVPDMAGVERFWGREPDFGGPEVPSKTKLKGLGREKLDNLAPAYGIDPGDHSKADGLVDAIHAELEGGADIPAMFARQAEAEAARKRDEWRAGILDSAALDPFTAQVVAVAIVDAQGGAIEVKEAHADEAEILAEVHRSLTNVDRVVMFADGGHFDARVLQTRMLVHGIEVPKVIRECKRYDRNRCVDLRGILGHFDRYQRGNLGDWCWRFGLPEPVETDLEELATWVAEGEWEAIADHVWGHTQCVAELYRKVRPVLQYLPLHNAPVTA